MPCLLIIVLFLARPVYAAMPLPEVLDRMDKAQMALNDATFQYVQLTKRGSLPNERTGGEVQIKRPRSLRVVQTTPSRQIVTTDGQTLWLYSPSQQQLLKGDWNAWLKISRFPIVLIDVLGTLTPENWRTRYKALFGGYHDKRYEIHFKPVRPGDYPVTLWVSEETFLPVKGELADESLKVQVEIKGVETNTGLQAQLFEPPKVPAGTAEVPIAF
jgi:outer membrane lipoprotein-sorting protein